MEEKHAWMVIVVDRDSNIVANLFDSYEQALEFQSVHQETTMFGPKWVEIKGGSVSHKYSIELLVHYQCGACQQWWTIGDDLVGSDGGTPRYCPRCGVRDVADPMVMEGGWRKMLGVDE